MKNARPQTTEASAQEQREFNTDNPRHCRALALLLQRPAKREEIDNRAGCSNAPELIAELRRRGLEAPCTRVPAIDRDGKPCRPGIYRLTDADRRKVDAWLRRRQQGFSEAEFAVVLFGACLGVAWLVEMLLRWLA